MLNALDLFFHAIFFFFFQAEDGIRDKLVTGVQTCALPISFPDPTREITPSCSARSTFACAERLLSPTSSRNSVPPSASSNLPARSANAPVQLPFMRPARSLSLRPVRLAAQLTSTNGPAARGLRQRLA